MRFYYGIPVGAPGGGLRVKFSDDKKGGAAAVLPQRLDLAPTLTGGFGWGMSKPAGPSNLRVPNQGGAQLALALCAHALHDDRRAMAVYKRFQHRVVNDLAALEAWSLTSFGIEGVVQQIEADAEEAREAARHEKPERPPVVSEGGVTAAGGKIVWDTDDEGRTINPDDRIMRR